MLALPLVHINVNKKTLRSMRSDKNQPFSCDVRSLAFFKTPISVHKDKLHAKLSCLQLVLFGTKVNKRKV